MLIKKKLIKGRKILVNKARCTRCGDTLVSTDPDKIVYCTCLAVHISGGTRKTLRGGTLNFLEECSTFV
jgi:hypothetical protein